MRIIISICVTSASPFSLAEQAKKAEAKNTVIEITDLKKLH